MNRILRNTALVLLLSLVGATALANGPCEKLDGSGFALQVAKNQVTAQHARGEMWLTEGDEGFSAQLEYAFAILRPEVQQVSQVHPSLASRLGERLEQ